MKDLLLSCCIGAAIWTLGLGLIVVGKIVTIIEDAVDTWRLR